jgi:hypothetical protein
VITCPVCEHQQAGGADCEVCGRLRSAGGATPIGVEVPVASLEGLEPTAQADAAAPGDVAPLPELEPTLQVSAGAVVIEPLPELEPTGAASTDPSHAAPGEALPGLEPTFAPASDARTALPLFPVCRYCRTPAGPGERLCGRCGMQLGGVVAPPPGRPGDDQRRCSCGAPITRSICPACGGRHRVE